MARTKKAKVKPGWGLTMSINRRASKLRQNVVAEAAGITAPVLSGIEHGRRPCPLYDIRVRLYDALGLPRRDRLYMERMAHEERCSKCAHLIAKPASEAP